MQDQKCADQLFHAFEMETDWNGNRMFQKAKSGLVFECFQLLDPTVSPSLVIVARDDASHQGHHDVSRHPVYCEYFIPLG